MLSASDWWAGGRWRYNCGLIIAGISGFIGYVMAADWVQDRVAVEITLFTTIFQGIGYLFATGVASICYSFGAIVELFVPRRWVDTYRRRAYAMGFWFSMALPFLPMLGLFICAIWFPDDLHHPSVR